MSLQKRLIFLLAVFAVFALAATFGTIYSTHLRVEEAVAGFQRTLDSALWIDQLHLEAHEQYTALRDIVDGVRDADEDYRARRDRFFDRLRAATGLAPTGDDENHFGALSTVGAELDREFERCLTLAEAAHHEQARAVVTDPIATRLMPALEASLRRARSGLEPSRERSVDALAATNTQVLVVSLVIGILGVSLITIGTALVRRWVILPIGKLHSSAEEFGTGNLGHRVDVSSGDELGQLGEAMNRMAESLAAAQVDLRVSEAKYRSLFENLRDATIICDSGGHVVECHDGDTRLLGDEGRDCVGRPLSDLWPRWRGQIPEDAYLIDTVLTRGAQVRIDGIRLARREDSEESAVVDLVAYPVEYRTMRCVAVVLRDVTARTELEREARRAEAMEATVTFARGVAHDFNNLLTSAIGTLSSLTTEPGSKEPGDRVRRALRACWQAAGLARKLLDFSGGDRGEPQVLCLGETVDVILESFDESFWRNIRLHTDCARSVMVHIDRDQLTQIVLNLIHNARDAMPDGGDLNIEVNPARAGGPAKTDDPPTHALLTVSDTGCGITPEVKVRLFEPVFTTKTHNARRGRGLGLAVVRAAVRNANGLIEVGGQAGVGATFRVYLPLAENMAEGVTAITTPSAGVEN